MKETCYEGKYFKDRDFYDWGIDYEFYGLCAELDQNLTDIDFIMKPLEKNIGIVNINELDLREKEIFDDFLENVNQEKINEILTLSYNEEEKYKKMQQEINVLSKYSFEEIKENSIILNLADEYIKAKETKNKMLIIYLYTIFDSFCSEFFKAIAMYNKSFIAEQEVKITYNDINETDNATDLIEKIVDGLLNTKFGNIMSKLQRIYQYLEMDFSNINERIYIFGVERNCLVHNNGVYSEKALKRIRNDYKERFIQQKQVNLQDNIIEEYKELIEKVIDEIEEKVQTFYFPEYELKNLDNNSEQS